MRTFVATVGRIRLVGGIQGVVHAPPKDAGRESKVVLSVLIDAQPIPVLAERLT